MYLHPSDLRHANTRRVFRSLLTGTTWSRATLARQIGLSSVTTGKIVDELIDAGLAEELPDSGTPTIPTTGRPPRLLRLCPTPTYAAVQIGVHRTTVSALSIRGVQAPETIRTIQTPPTAEEFLKQIRRLAGAVLAKPRAVLVSVPGLLDEAQARVVHSTNLPWLETPGILHSLAGVWPAPLCAVQEVQALALGHQATHPSTDNFLMLDIGDGVGGAIVTGGQLLESSLPMTGEIGHTAVPGVHRQCGCGGVGCLETILGKPGMLQTFKEVHGHKRATWEQLTDHVQSKGIEPWLAEVVDRASSVIGGAINLLGIRETAVVGYFPSLHPELMPMLAERVGSRALARRLGPVRCEAAEDHRLVGLVVSAADRLVLREPTRPERSAPSEPAAIPA
jgi:predicted NBD/HSP70 family sugar kinase